MGKTNKALFPALVAVGGQFAVTPANAIELGELTVQSTLGQPLRASIAYALAPSEELANYCVALKPGIAGSGLPSVTRAEVSVANGVISITGAQPIREPLMTMRVDVACRYTPNLSREYMLFIDPPLTVPQTVVVADTPITAPVAIQSAPVVVTAAAPAAVARRATIVSREPIAASERYRVQPGDSLSLIAERIQDRPIGLWNAVTQIFAANPDAFIHDDPNKLKAGSWLTIPDFNIDAGSATPVFSAATGSTSSTATSPDTNSTVGDSTVTEPGSSAAATYDGTYGTSTHTDSPVTDLQPGDIILDRENPFVTVADPSVVIPDTELETPTTSGSPNVPVATIVTPKTAPQSATNWLLWLVGGGIALIVALLAFGRKNLGRGAPAPTVDTAAQPLRRRSDTATVEVLQPSEYDISDDSPTEENLILDADLELGTGLGVSVDIDVAEDFGYSTALDLELPAEKDAGDTTIGTDELSLSELSLPSTEQSSILESELLEDDDDYDMSVIVDATKMPRTDEVTKHDLRAVAVEGEDETLIQDNYTVSQEVDYHILEQDYEDELTATQALSKEIEKAAAELAHLADNDPINDDTALQPLASVTALSKSANDPIGDFSNSGDTVSITEEITQSIVAEDKTVEMPAAGNDDTIEMTIESGKVDTKSG